MSSLQQVAQTRVFTPRWQTLWACWRETEWGLEIKIGAIVDSKSTPITTIISSKPLYFYHPYVSCRCEPVNNHISSTVTHAHTRVMLQFHPGQRSGHVLGHFLQLLFSSAVQQAHYPAGDPAEGSRVAVKECSRAALMFRPAISVRAAFLWPERVNHWVVMRGLLSLLFNVKNADD